MKWTDTLDIAMRLHERHPHVDPLAVRFTDLREWILRLSDFDDDPGAANEGRLEAIQMAWCDELDA